MSQLKGSQKGCKLGKRSAIRGFDKMSDRRKARLNALDAVVVGTVLTRRGRMVAEVQLVDPKTGGVVAQFSAGSGAPSTHQQPYHPPDDPRMGLVTAAA